MLAEGRRHLPRVGFLKLGGIGTGSIVDIYSEKSMITFGHLLGWHLQSKGWSGVDFARRTQSSQSHLSKILRGVRPPPLEQVDVWIHHLQPPPQEAMILRLAASLAHTPPIVLDTMVEMLAQGGMDLVTQAPRARIVAALLTCQHPGDLASR